jgi:hypothetical protein
MEDQEQEENKMDVITVDVPLFIRLLEFAREDATDDMMLHDVAEKLIELCADGGIMTMEQYDEIVGSKEDKAATSGMNAVEDNMHPQNKDMDTINEQRWMKLAGLIVENENGNDSWNPSQGTIKWLQPSDPEDVYNFYIKDETIEKGEFYKKYILKSNGLLQPTSGRKDRYGWNFDFKFDTIEGFEEGSDFEFVKV